MDLVSRSGQIIRSMMDSGVKVKLTDRVDFIMLMEIFMMDIGKMIKPMDMDNILILMVLNTKAIGSTTNSMDKAWNLRPMAPSMKENT